MVNHKKRAAVNSAATVLEGQKEVITVTLEVSEEPISNPAPVPAEVPVITVVADDHEGVVLAPPSKKKKAAKVKTLPAPGEAPSRKSYSTDAADATSQIARRVSEHPECLCLHGYKLWCICCKDEINPHKSSCEKHLDSKRHVMNLEQMIASGVEMVPPESSDTDIRDIYKNSVTAVELSSKSPYASFTRATATLKVRAAEDLWNSRDPTKVALAYDVDTHWRNRSDFLNGRDEVQEFLVRKWAKEHEYRLIKELWAYDGKRIAVRFAYEWQDDSKKWFRSYGNENWEFSDTGLLSKRYASINDVPITQDERKFLWPQGARPTTHPGLSELGL